MEVGNDEDENRDDDKNKCGDAETATGTVDQSNQCTIDKSARH